KFETLLEESGAIYPKAAYTSRFISFKELTTINSLASNNQIIESQEDIPIERMNELMLEIEKDKAAS
ncbi:21949_t:CDS:2, partial [Gigaspora margarita]